ncbi:hypothetical protein [Actinomadura opuntiae]|uniref:hypothetical protein n=1 Tax=Actinomadura sp. OS1-43 TaxID=604315 RepID=UPI00255A7449|nr:hypothetical protein [Actinomadura sp. OS1-43]MDL4814036.1 hypothetical protein [Actinomadura sp. OS1-43]
MAQPTERAATSLRLAGPALGLGLEETDVDAYLEAARSGAIIPETSCDKGMQDNHALRTATRTSLPTAELQSA